MQQASLQETWEVREEEHRLQSLPPPGPREFQHQDQRRGNATKVFCAREAELNKPQIHEE